MSKNYSIKFYTGGVDVAKWSELTQKEKKEALEKSWYIRWYFQNPKTNKLERQGNMKSGVNRYHKMSDRVEFLKQAKKFLKTIIKEGYSPYEKSIEDHFETERKSLETRLEYQMKRIKVVEEEGQRSVQLLNQTITIKNQKIKDIKQNYEERLMKLRLQLEDKDKLLYFVQAQLKQGC